MEGEREEVMMSQQQQDLFLHSMLCWDPPPPPHSLFQPSHVLHAASSSDPLAPGDLCTPNLPQAPGSAMTVSQAQPQGTLSATNGPTVQQKPRVRARRGQATDPHSIAERLRRERIAERMKALQELIPNTNKTDKASMLDEIIDYVRFLQLQVKVLSMSRLGGAAAVAPLMADISSEGGGECLKGRSAAHSSSAGNGNPAAASNESLKTAERRVAKLMEEDMGSAMQYLQGKGLCLMPISLAAAISSATSHSRASLCTSAAAAEGPSSPSVSPSSLNNAN